MRLDVLELLLTLLDIRQLDERHQHLLNDPRPLVLVSTEDLQSPKPTSVPLLPPRSIANSPELTVLNNPNAAILNPLSPLFPPNTPIAASAVFPFTAFSDLPFPLN